MRADRSLNPSRKAIARTLVSRCMRTKFRPQDHPANGPAPARKLGPPRVSPGDRQASEGGIENFDTMAHRCSKKGQPSVSFPPPIVMR
jgi:hypothetical protein